MRLKKRLQAAVYGLEVLTRYRHRATLARVGDRVVVSTHTESGDLFVHLLDHGVGRPLYTGQAFEPTEVAILRKHLRPGMMVVDIGANIGFMTCLAAQLVGATGRVLAIEPEPANVALLRANVARQGLDQTVTVYPCAAGAAGGTIGLSRSEWNFGDHRVGTSGPNTITVDVRTVDELAHHLPRVDFVKMDVQGYEVSVFAGMRNTLATHRPIVLSEFWPYGLRAAGVDPKRCLDSWREAGYSWTVIGGDTAAEAVPEREDAFVNLLLTPNP
jgi:FkbM family methyltransferase